VPDGHRVPDFGALEARLGRGGRALLTCDEKSQSFPDAVNWSHSFVLDGELVETPLTRHIHTAALKQFWLFETATFRGALNRFAARIPAAQRPPS
jgi:hypothetical protein